jgi:hypothetical protein
MNIVIAQLKKDIRCQRGTLILWVVCLLLGGLPYAIGTVLKHGHGKPLESLNLTDSQMFVGAISFVAISMMCIMAAGFGMFLLLPILVTRIVHEDPLMGTTAFWQTRPIPRPKLLLAKALFICVLLLPLMLAMARGGKIGEDQFWPAMAGWIAAVAAIASITPGTAAWFGYGLSFLFGKLVFSGIINRLWEHYHGSSQLFSEETLSPLIAAGKFLHLNASDFFHLCYLAGFAIVFIHQYLTLRRKRSLALFIVTLVIVGVLQMVAGPSAADTDPVIRINSSSSSTP